MIDSQRALVFIADAIENGDCVPFVGPDGGAGTPSIAEMATQLLAEAGCPGIALSLPEAAQRYEQRRDLNTLIRRMGDWLKDPAAGPGPVHRLLARLPFRFYFTTAYHDFLEQALRDVERPAAIVVTSADTAYTHASGVTVFKFLGDLSRPDSLILTKFQHTQFLRRTHLLCDIVKAELSRNTLLFVQYDLSDQALESLFSEVASGQGLNKRSAYALCPQVAEFDQDYWQRNYSLRFIDADPVTFLETLDHELDRRKSANKGQIITPPAEAPVARRPYRFLDAFGPGDARLFAGRDDEIEELSQKILAHHLVVLTGASGTGKTSLLQAGVGLRLAGNGWRTVFARLLDDPLSDLRHALEPWICAAPLESASDRAADLRSLVLAAEAATQERLVIVFDQFEDIFFRLGPQAQTAFIAQLAPCLTDLQVDTRFVLSLREDFLSRLTTFGLQIPDILHNVYRLERLSREQALAAVLKPLKVVGFEMESGLADRIVTELDRQGIDPPQLQIVCDRLYAAVLKNGRKRITAADYERLGGIEKVLPAYLSDVLARQPQAKGVLEALVGEGGLKAARTQAEIAARVGAQTADLLGILETLIAERLVRILQEGETVRYELVHDVLAAAIWAWLAEGAKEAERARGILERGLSDWTTSESLLDAQRLDFVAERWPFLGVVEAQFQALLLRSAVQLGHDVPRWLDRVTDPALDRQVLLALSAHPDAEARGRALTWLTKLPDAGSAPVLDTLRRAAVADSDEGARRAAALALHEVQSDEAVRYLVSQAATGDPVAQRGALGSLAVLGDANKPVWHHLGIGLWARIAAAVGRLRLTRHWPQWGWRAGGAALGGEIGLAAAFLLLYLFAGRQGLSAALYHANIALPYGAIGGLVCGLGLGIAAALADGERLEARLAGGLFGGAIGCALALQLHEIGYMVGMPGTAAIVTGLLAGAIMGLGLALAPVVRKEVAAQMLVGAVAGAVGFAAAAPFTPPLYPSPAHWPFFIMPWMGAATGALIAGALALADRLFERLAAAGDVPKTEKG
jgi:hypothetical protein